MTYENGMLTLKFQRAKDTGDDKDWKLSDTDCYYFIFPVGGGTVSSSTEFGAHSNVPVISDQKMCIGRPNYNTLHYNTSRKPGSRGKQTSDFDL